MGHHRSKSPNHRRTIPNPNLTEPQESFLIELGRIYDIGKPSTPDCFGRRPALASEVEGHILSVRRGKEY